MDRMSAGPPYGYPTPCVNGGKGLAFNGFRWGGQGKGEGRGGERGRYVCGEGEPIMRWRVEMGRGQKRKSE